MKKIFIALCFLSASSFVSAQANKAKDSLLKVMAKEVCDEMSKGDPGEAQSMEDLQMQMGLAFLPLMTKYSEQLETVLHIDVSTTEGMEALGTDIGMRLITECPAFLKMLAKNPGALKSAIGEKNAEPKLKSTGAISGTLLKIVPGDFSYLQVKTKNGKLEKIWWMEYFEGSDKLTTEAASMLNKPISINYVEKEIYSSTMKDYVKIKVAVEIE